MNIKSRCKICNKPLDQTWKVYCPVHFIEAKKKREIDYLKQPRFTRKSYVDQWCEHNWGWFIFLAIYLLLII